MFEKLLIASILLDPAIFSNLHIKSWHFKDETCAKIFMSMEKLKVFDSITVAEDSGVPFSDITEYISMLPSGANALLYEQKIMDEFKKQELHGLAKELLEIEDVSETIIRLQKRLDEIGVDKNPVSQKQKMTDYFNQLEEPVECVPSGLHDLDLLLGGGYPKGEMAILAARPAVGKTAFMISNIVNIDKSHKPYIQSLEMNYNQLADRYFSCKMNIDGYQIRLRSKDAIGKIAMAMPQLERIVIDDTSLIDVPLLRMKIKSAVKSGTQIVFIDYLQLMEVHTEGTRNEQVSAISRALKLLAKDLNIAIVALSQLRRIDNNIEPDLIDLRDSGSLEQDAAIVVFLHRPFREDDLKNDILETKCIVRKNRFGKVGYIKLMFNAGQSKFTCQSQYKEF